MDSWMDIAVTLIDALQNLIVVYCVACGHHLFCLSVSRLGLSQHWSHEVVMYGQVDDRGHCCEYDRTFLSWFCRKHTGIPDY